MRNCRRDANGLRCWQETHDQRWWSLPDVMNRLEEVGLSPLLATPIGEVPHSQGGRWTQIVARRL